MTTDTFLGWSIGPYPKTSLVQQSNLKGFSHAAEYCSTVTASG